MIELLAYKIQKISATNCIEGKKELELTHNLKYEINYKDDVKTCDTNFNLDITAKDISDTDFKIELNLLAQFRYQDGDSHSYIQSISYDLLFPYIRMFVSGITNLSGMPSLLIPYIPFKNDDVKVDN